MDTSSGGPLTIATLPGATQCVALIDQLTAGFKQTFKRNPVVSLSVSVTFAEGSSGGKPSRQKRTKDWANPLARDTFTVTARLSDPQSADQQWEAQWFKAAAAQASIVTPSTSATRTT